MTKKARKRTSASLLAGAACLVAGALYFTSLAGSGMASASDVDAGGKYYAAYEDYAELLEAVGEVNLQTAEEGQVLLKNDGTLPLNGNESVSVFGIASSTTVGGPNSGDAYWEYTGNEVSDRGPIYDSLEAAGFRVNPTLVDYYAGLGFSNSDIGNETTEFTNQVNNSLKLYDDVGVIVLSRYGGEGSDLALITDEEEDNMYGDEEAGFEHDALYKGEYVASSGGGGGMGGPPGMGSTSYDVAQTSENYDAENGTEYKHYLQLTDSEEELIDYVSSKCKKVIVVLNTSNAMECYDLREDDRVNGILLMGRGGDTGHMAVGEILAGLVNPSGKLVDEWNTDFTADPTWNNFAWNDQTGSQNMYYDGEYGTGLTEYTGNGNYDDYLTRGTTEITYGSHNQSGYYGTDYEEDIYLGYAYWETLYYEIYNALLENQTVSYQGNGVKHTVTRATTGDSVEENAAIAANEWWRKNVTFAFGYGLSYTSFSFDIDANGIIATGGALESEDEVIYPDFDISTDMTKENLDSSEGSPAAIKTLYIPVTVTNTGDVSGKEVVQIYVTAPYDGENAKLEKSFVTLVGFGKTDELDPGESQTVYVQVNVQDMASFDYEDVYNDGVTGYTLDEGEYTIRAMNTSHYDFLTDLSDTTDAYDEVGFEVAEGTEGPGSGAARLVLDDFSGNESGAIFSDSYEDSEYVEGNVWATDTDEDHYQIYNSLRTSNLMADGTSEQVNITRDTFLTYFPQAPTEGDLTLSSSYIDHMDYWNQFSAADTSSDEWYKDASITEDEGVDGEGWAQGTGVADEETGLYDIVLSDMSGIELRDEDGTLSAEWNTFMNQLTVSEMTTLIRKNYNMWRSTGISTIGKAANQQKDSYNNNGDTLLWVDAPTITATWNTDLAYDIGQVRGNLSLFNGWSAWGGPKMDTHRSPFSGRNYEYLSQDGIVGGYIAAGLTGGMEAMGVTCYVKHFALNDQETCRDGMENMVWLSEAAARQIYFKVFQMAMQEGGSSSSMTGFARFCGIPTSSNNHLMEGMVVDQWGWDGFFITDGYSGFSRCTTMSSMMRSYVVPLPLNSAIPAISGRYDEEEGLFYAYTGAWDTEATQYYDTDGQLKDIDFTTTMYNDRGEEAGTATGYYTGEEQVSYTQWYYMRMLAARILYAECNSLTNLNGHSTTTLPTLSNEDLTFAQGESVDLTFELSGEAASCIGEDGSKLYDAEYSITDGELPAGLSFDASTGTLSGTPTTVGTYTIEVSVVIDGWVSSDLVNDDRDSINGNLTKQYTITVESGFALVDGEDSTTAVSTQLTAGDLFVGYISSDNVDGTSYSYTGTLPEGIEFNAEEGFFYGTVSDTAVNGEYNIVVTVTEGSSSGGNQGGGGWPGGPGGGWPGGPGGGWPGGGGGSSSSSYEYAITFTVSGGTDPVEEEDPVYLTKEEVEELINSALGGILTEDDIQAMIDEATSSITSITEADVQALIDAAIAEYDAQSGSETTDENSGCSGSGAGVAMIVMLAAAAAVSGAVIVAKSRKKGDK